MLDDAEERIERRGRVGGAFIGATMVCILFFSGTGIGDFLAGNGLTSKEQVALILALTYIAEHRLAIELSAPSRKFRRTSIYRKIGSVVVAMMVIASLSGIAALLHPAMKGSGLCD
jgi:hypothetical protein